MIDRICPNPMYTPEFVCKIIEPTCELLSQVWSGSITKVSFWIEWESDETCFCHTPQDAWREAFQMLDRRKEQP